MFILPLEINMLVNGGGGGEPISACHQQGVTSSTPRNTLTGHLEYDMAIPSHDLLTDSPYGGDLGGLFYQQRLPKPASNSGMDK